METLILSINLIALINESIQQKRILRLATLLAKLLAEHELESVEAFHQWSVADYPNFWRTMLKKLNIKKYICEFKINCTFGKIMENLTDLITVKCKNCGKKIAEAKIVEGKLSIKCHKCGTINTQEIKQSKSVITERQRIQTV